MMKLHDHLILADNQIGEKMMKKNTQATFVEMLCTRKRRNPNLDIGRALQTVAFILFASQFTYAIGMEA